MTRSELTPYPSQKVHVVEDEDATGDDVEGAAETGAAEDGGDDTTIGVSITVANGAAVDGAIVSTPFADETIIDGAADGARDVGVPLDGASDVGVALDGASVVRVALDGASVVSGGREKSTLRLSDNEISRNCNTRTSLKECPSRTADPFFPLLYT